MMSGLANTLHRIREIRSLLEQVVPAPASTAGGTFQQALAEQIQPLPPAVAGSDGLPGLLNGSTALPQAAGSLLESMTLPPAEVRALLSQGATLRPATGPELVEGTAEIQQKIIEMAEKWGLDPDLLLAIARAESNFNPQAVSPKGAKGVMQLMPGTAASLGVTNPFDPAQNIEAGVRYFRQLLDQFGDVRQALAAYNAGPGAVQKYDGLPPFAETRAYLERVLAYWQQFKNQDRPLPELPAPTPGPDEYGSMGVGEYGSMGVGEYGSGRVLHSDTPTLSTPTRHPSPALPTLETGLGPGVQGFERPGVQGFERPGVQGFESPGFRGSTPNPPTPSLPPNPGPQAPPPQPRAAGPPTLGPPPSDPSHSTAPARTEPPVVAPSPPKAEAPEPAGVTRNPTVEAPPAVGPELVEGQRMSMEAGSSGHQDPPLEAGTPPSQPPATSHQPPATSHQPSSSPGSRMQELAEAIVRQSQLAEAEQRPEFRMQLDLAQDGSLHVRVAREQGLIHVSLGAAQEGFRETLMGNVGQLREALQNVGLELGQFSVEAQADGGRAPRQQAPLDPPRPRPSRTSGSRGAAGEPTLTAAAVGGAALNVWA